MMKPPGIVRPKPENELITKEGLALQWRDRAGVAPASSIHLQLLL
jgi:hypothetical protein